MAVEGSEALALLLPTESFLLAAISVAVGFDAASRFHVPLVDFPRPIFALVLTLTAALTLAGALVAWWQIYGGGSVRPFDEATIGVALLAAVLGQGLLTIGLAFSVFDG